MGPSTANVIAGEEKTVTLSQQLSVANAVKLTVTAWSGEGGAIWM